MKNTELISGEFKFSADNNCSIDVTLNEKIANIPLKLNTTSDANLSFDGVMDLENWDGIGAIPSMNKACEALHRGKDGISKTWGEVTVHADVFLNKN